MTVYKGSKGRIYNIYKGMKNRCYNKSCNEYKYYGGRGINIHSEWLYNFDNFCKWAIDNGYADNLSIDRIDNDDGYAPENCRWITKGEQNRNQRNTNHILYKGEYYTYGQLASLVGMDRRTFRSRIERGMSVDEALNTPLKETCKKYYIIKGKQYNINQIAEEFNIEKYIIYLRLKLGWSMDKIISTPIKKYRKRK